MKYTYYFQVSKGLGWKEKCDFFFRAILKYKPKLSIKCQGNKKFTLHIINAFFETLYTIL